MSEYNGLTELKEIYALTKDVLELESKKNEAGNKIWKLKRERISLGNQIATLNKKKIGIITKHSGLNYINEKKEKKDE